MPDPGPAPDAQPSSAPAPPSRRRLPFRTLALIATAAAFALVALAEVIARKLVPFQPPIYCTHPYCGHVWSPNLHIEYRTRGGKGEMIALETNAFGFRGKSMTTSA